MCSLRKATAKTAKTLARASLLLAADQDLRVLQPALALTCRAARSQRLVWFGSPLEPHSTIQEQVELNK